MGLHPRSLAYGLIDVNLFTTLLDRPVYHSPALAKVFRSISQFPWLLAPPHEHSFGSTPLLSSPCTSPPPDLFTKPLLRRVFAFSLILRLLYFSRSPFDLHNFDPVLPCLQRAPSIRDPAMQVRKFFFVLEFGEKMWVITDKFTLFFLQLPFTRY
jgi:hypothetical protein